MSYVITSCEAEQIDLRKLYKFSKRRTVSLKFTKGKVNIAITAPRAGKRLRMLQCLVFTNVESFTLDVHQGLASLVIQEVSTGKDCTHTELMISEFLILI